ncbi:MAG: hypothetical protein JSS77_07920 [Acidobacteria bacterium]|nr:hypothetical protein [Acidobacteriota bacterium]
MTDKAATVKNLAETLSRLDIITQYDSPDHSEAWTIAISLTDLSDSFKAVNDTLLPRLRMASGSVEINAILLEIADEFRHILFHIHAMKFYQSLKMPTDGA